MYKNQLQELAQRSCFNLPSYACIREGPDHAPRFKASVNFNGEIFESPTYCTTLRQAEHAAAEVALNALSTWGPSRSLTARVLDETGVYKNLLQETAHRTGLKLPVYTTVRSGPGHVPVFTCTVELAGMNFTGESAKTKKQAEKNAAIAAWSALKKMPNLGSLSQLTSKETDNREEQDQAIVARVLSNFRPKDEIRRRDQNQGRRRMEKGTHRDNTCQQWRSIEDCIPFPEGPTQKHKCFVSLLPPPIATSSRSKTRPTPLQFMGKAQVIMQEHQKDEDEWLNGKYSDVIKEKEKEGPSNSTSTIVYGATNSIYRPFAGKHNSLNQCQSPSPVPIKAPTSSHMGRAIYSGGYHPHRIAPAVQIRSVIPVCAAPPPSMKEAASSSSTTSMSKHTGAQVFSSVSPNLSKLQSYSTQLSSEFNKLQL
uniref:DRBM domain-containing protein n=1 Tax=Davidia involucrata TaxID=16924 RepID=A0A5B7BX89_DAVIN